MLDDLTLAESNQASSPIKISKTFVLALSAPHFPNDIFSVP